MSGVRFRMNTAKVVGIVLLVIGGVLWASDSETPFLGRPLPHWGLGVLILASVCYFVGSLLTLKDVPKPWDRPGGRQGDTRR